MSAWTRSLFLFTLLFLALPVPSPAATRPDPETVLREVLRPYDGMRDYTVQIEAKVRIPDFRVPDFAATVYFKKPDLFRLETKSFAPLPRGTALFDPGRFRPEKNRVSWLTGEVVNGVPTDVFRVEPADEKGKIRFYRLWIGGEPKRILQLESVSVQGAKALARIRYALVRQAGQGLWLPDRVDVKMTFPERTDRPENLLYGSDSPVARGMARLEKMPAGGSVEVTYSGWKWNTGLEDDLFRKK